MDINRGGSWGDDKLTFGIGRDRGAGTGISGSAEPFFDKQAGHPKVKMTDFSVLGSIGSGERELSKEELFRALWDRIMDQLESRL
jgi:hypothetical protein